VERVKNVKYVYLAGKISIGDKNTFYRNKAAEKLRKAGFECLDPLRSKRDTSKWKTLEPSEIVYRDLQDVKRASVVLAVINEGGKKISFGTPCECMFAWMHHIPVVLVSNNEALRNHFWVKIICSRAFAKVDEAIDYIIDWHGNDEEISDSE